MATTKRKDIINDLLYRMGTIRASSGYSTDLGVTVTHRRDTIAEPFDEGEVPALNVQDGDAVITHNLSDDNHALEVDFTIHTTSRVSSDDLDDMLGDVIRCIEENETWGGHADGTDIESHGVDTTQTSDTIAAARIRITIKYSTDKGKI